MRKLSDVKSFGGIEADADALLEDCFQDHAAYQTLLSHERPFVIGRKGSGKTAIFRRVVMERRHDFFSFGHTFGDYPWQHHRLQELVGVPEEQRYVHSWQYLMLVTAAKILLNQDHSQPWSDESLDDLGRLEKFVVDSYGSRDPDITEIFRPTKRLRIRPSLRISEYAELGLDLEKLPMSELPKVVTELNENILSAVLECLNPEFDYYICFDELDHGFDPTDARYSQMLVGLILAAKKVCNEAKKQNKRLSVAVFLRDDIYQSLRFEDKNKITQGMVSRIEWDTARSKWTLQQLMEKRFSSVLSDDPGSPESVLWGDVFDESQEMTGRQSKYQHMLDRTFRRPRDMIKFCNEVLTSYQARCVSGSESCGKFTNDDIVSARPEYSEYLLNELEDEVHKHLPDYQDHLEVVKSLGALQFSLYEFQDICERRRDLFTGDVEPLRLLRDLFEFSVIGYQRTGGAGGGSEYVWRHMDSRVRFDESATYFRVHHGFMEAFGLRKFRKTG